MPAHPIWQKSSFSSGGSGDDCVELAAPCAPLGGVRLRESDTPTTVLALDRTALHTLLTTLKAGIRRP